MVFRYWRCDTGITLFVSFQRDGRLSDLGPYPRPLDEPSFEIKPIQECREWDKFCSSQHPNVDVLLRFHQSHPRVIDPGRWMIMITLNFSFPIYFIGLRPRPWIMPTLGTSKGVSSDLRHLLYDDSSCLAVYVVTALLRCSSVMSSVNPASHTICCGDV